MARAVLYRLHWILPTFLKVDILQHWLKLDQAKFVTSQKDMSRSNFPFRYDRIDPELATTITVRRQKMVQDSFAKLFRLKEKLKGNVKIEFVSEEGLAVRHYQTARVDLARKSGSGRD